MSNYEASKETYRKLRVLGLISDLTTFETWISIMTKLEQSYKLK